MGICGEAINLVVQEGSVSDSESEDGGDEGDRGAALLCSSFVAIRVPREFCGVV